MTKCNDCIYRNCWNEQSKTPDCNLDNYTSECTDYKTRQQFEQEKNHGCPVCHGGGSIGNSSTNPNCVDQWIECPTCNGTGYEPEGIPKWLRSQLMVLIGETLRQISESKSDPICQMFLESNHDVLCKVLSLKKPEETP